MKTESESEKERVNERCVQVTDCHTSNQLRIKQVRGQVGR